MLTDIMSPFLKKKILIIAAHPDDELLGLGGTINQCSTKKKSKVKLLIMSKGLTSRDNKLDKGKMNTQIQNANKAAEILGIKDIKFADLPDNRFDSVDLLDIVKIIENEIKDFKPDVIFTHHEKDLNIDHQNVFQAVLTATRPLPGTKSLLLITFETPSSTEWQAQDSHTAFNPNFYNKISKANLVAKQKAMKSYINEYRPYPHPRSSKALEIIARRWGTVIGEEFVEAFKIIRFTNKN
tara:strand:+ start:1760 stop:2476 length:717 start_codon:yes stop_codon:yes gene_type:complete